MTTALPSHEIRQRARIEQARAVGAVIAATARLTARALCRLRARTGFGGRCLETRTA
jgi:hypothetical protein